jgi:hypothetical protein
MGELALGRDAIDDRREQSRQLLKKHLAGQAAVARQIARVGAQCDGNLLRLNGFISTVANPGTDDLTVARVFRRETSPWRASGSTWVSSGPGPRAPPSEQEAIEARRLRTKNLPSQPGERLAHALRH